MDDKEYRESPVTIPAFDGGINTFDSPSTIQDNQLNVGSFNFDTERRGLIIRRPGNRLYGSKLSWSNWYEDGYGGGP